jgi:hypothetical protein
LSGGFAAAVAEATLIKTSKLTRLRSRFAPKQVTVIRLGGYYEPM